MEKVFFLFRQIPNILGKIFEMDCQMQLNQSLTIIIE